MHGNTAHRRWNQYSTKQVSDCNSTRVKDCFESLHSQHSMHSYWRCVIAHHFHGLSCLLLDELQSWINIAVKQTEHVLLHMEEGRRREREREGEGGKSKEIGREGKGRKERARGGMSSGSGLKKRKENQLSKTDFQMKFTKCTHTHTHLGNI